MAKQIDGYQLFRKLDSGEPITLSVNGQTYVLQFQGERFGGNNLLVVSAEDGRERRYGWGWESRLVFQALEELQGGWDSPQKYRYHPLGTSCTREHAYV